MKLPKNTVRLLHDLAAEIEAGFAGYVSGVGDMYIELSARDASKVLARYEKWRKQLKKIEGGQP